MALNIWQRARITAVYSPVGTHSNGDVKLTRQNFDILKWTPPGGTADETFVVSPRADSHSPIGIIENHARANSTNVLDEGLTQDYGWYTPEPLVVDFNRNSKNGDDENLLDFHFFGPV